MCWFFMRLIRMHVYLCAPILQCVIVWLWVVRLTRIYWNWHWPLMVAYYKFVVWRMRSRFEKIFKIWTQTRKTLIWFDIWSAEDKQVFRNVLRVKLKLDCRKIFLLKERPTVRLSIVTVIFKNVIIGRAKDCNNYRVLSLSRS